MLEENRIYTMKAGLKVVFKKIEGAWLAAPYDEPPELMFTIAGASWNPDGTHVCGGPKRGCPLDVVRGCPLDVVMPDTSERDRVLLFNALRFALQVVEEAKTLGMSPEDPDTREYFTSRLKEAFGGSATL